MNTTNHGKDENGDWVPIGATTDTSGNPAANVTVDKIRNTFYPHTISLLDSGSTTADAEVLSTLSNSTAYNMLTIVVSAFTATTLDITVSQDGTNFGAALPSKDNPVTAGAAIAAVGTYHLEGSFDAIKMTQAGAGGVTAQWRQWVK